MLVFSGAGWPGGLGRGAKFGVGEPECLNYLELSRVEHQ